MKTLMMTFCFIISLSNSTAQDTLNLSDFKILDSTSWKGQLIYKDFQSGNENSVDATLQIHISGKAILYDIQYTYEPKKNNRNSIRLKKNGTYYGNEKVLSNTFSDGTRTFVTTHRGKDNGKQATMFITHQFNKNTYTETKEVLLDNSVHRFIRNRYTFTKL